jgi:hypothetical protein
VEVVREENGGTAMQVMLLFECPWYLTGQFWSWLPWFEKRLKWVCRLGVWDQMYEYKWRRERKDKSFNLNFHFCIDLCFLIRRSLFVLMLTIPIETEVFSALKTHYRIEGAS